MNVVVSFLFCLLLLWGETVGLVHAFRQHGVRDGWAAVFVPPVAWWRGIEFFFHQYPPVPQAAKDWPHFTTEELNIVSRVSGKAVNQPLSESDLTDLRSAIRSYTHRTGTPLTAEDV